MHLTKPFLIVVLVTLAACGGSGQDEAPPPARAVDTAQPVVSGRLEEGLRVLIFDPSHPGERFTIYRGDYVRPELAGGGPFTLEIPDLGVTMRVPAPEGERSYFKVPETGVYAVRIGEWAGEIEALEYSDARYREVDSQQAARLIDDLDPFILDVRTPSEFAAGHLQGAVLVPVQTLAQRMSELDEARTRPVFVYCRSGNRSTVAAKLLVEAGFSEVINLRRGIVAWEREGLPTVK